MTRFSLISIVVIIILAGFVRTYQLGSIPRGLSWDEAAVGYNGRSVWTIHRDEWLQIMPLSFKSFGDYKAPFAIYLNGVSTLLFGLSAFTIRLPYAASGVFSVALFIVFTFLLTKKSWWSRSSSIYGGLIFALLPWHVHFSRIAFESGIALMLIILAFLSAVVIFSFKFSASISRKYRVQLLIASLSGVCSALALYSYHSAKIFVPIFLVLSLVFFWQAVAKYFHTIRIYFGSLVLILLPLLWDTIFGSGATRSEVLLNFSLANPHEFFLTVVRNVAQHLDPSFLLFGLTDTFRHGDGQFGVVLPGMLLLLLVGVIAPFQQLSFRPRFKTETAKAAYLVAFIWLFAGMLPGWLSKDAPHANRTLLAIPGYIIFAMLGWDQLRSLMKASRPLITDIAKGLLGVCLLVDILWFAAYQHHYYTSYQRVAEDDFQVGYAELFSHLDNLKQTGALPSTVVMSKQYGQPYIYALLYGKIDAIAYHQGALNSYLFLDNVSIGDLSRNDALIVSTRHDQLSIPTDEVIYSPMGEPRFYLYDTNK